MNNNLEILKCKHDLIYFIENYCLINNKKIKLTEVQKQFLNNLQTYKNHFNYVRKI